MTVLQRLAKMDYLGIVLGAATWVTFTMALTMAGGQWPWVDGRTVGMFVAFGVILILYVLQQGFAIFTTKETRSFPVHLLKTKISFSVLFSSSGQQGWLVSWRAQGIFGLLATAWKCGFGYVHVMYH